MSECNQSFLGCNLIPTQGVTAGLTLGLIPSVHLQRHCQPVQPAGGGRAGVDREEGKKEKKREGRQRRRRRRREKKGS